MCPCGLFIFVGLVVSATGVSTADLSISRPQKNEKKTKYMGVNPADLKDKKITMSKSSRYNIYFRPKIEKKITRVKSRIFSAKNQKG